MQESCQVQETILEDIWRVNAQKISFLLYSMYDVLSTPTNLKTWTLIDGQNCKLCGKLADLDGNDSTHGVDVSYGLVGLGTVIFGVTLWFLIIIIPILVCCGGFSLCSFIICWCKQRHNLNKKGYIYTSSELFLSPPWVQTIQPDRNLENHGFGACSDGIQIVGPNSVTRFRQRNQEADGARWSVGLETGKHVFEVFWPVEDRGTHASVGVCSSKAPLYWKPKTSLVGMNDVSVGLDIGRRRIIYEGEPKKIYPRIMHVPEKFLMYVDCDSSELSFGTEESFWGIAFKNIDRRMYPLHIMVGLTECNAHVQIFYKGSAVSCPFHADDASTVCSPVAYSLYEILDPPAYDQLTVPSENNQPLWFPDSPPPPYHKMLEINENIV
ncbi:hypothetical protein CHS0354_032697 [Potamilus streckersoni]|uniref:B30.2/SPRY domain-containing protein n=1 Tax=Potamilus streckersoni TaxID=2493646 RepID=A0AAE0RQZ0_9BIVA|nr:hypothetical protein CHS0354_032697 [Potamilus streckersoni]